MTAPSPPLHGWTPRCRGGMAAPLRSEPSPSTLGTAVPRCLVMAGDLSIHHPHAAVPRVAGESSPQTCPVPPSTVLVSGELPLGIERQVQLHDPSQHRGAAGGETSDAHQGRAGLPRGAGVQGELQRETKAPQPSHPMFRGETETQQCCRETLTWSNRPMEPQEAVGRAAPRRAAG